MEEKFTIEYNNDIIHYEKIFLDLIPIDTLTLEIFSKELSEKSEKEIKKFFYFLNKSINNSSGLLQDTKNKIEDKIKNHAVYGEIIKDKLNHVDEELIVKSNYIIEELLKLKSNKIQTDIILEDLSNQSDDMIYTFLCEFIDNIDEDVYSEKTSLLRYISSYGKTAKFYYMIEKVTMGYNF